MTKAEEMQRLRELAAEIRLETLRIIGSLGFGHVGGSMSLADTMAVVYGAYMKFDPKRPDWEDRDWFVLSKGHAGPVMYATLGIMGYYPVSDAYTLNQAHTDFPSHTDRNKTKGVDLTTGSLGQGMSEATGAALGFKLQGRQNRVFAACGDGECNEGSVWEAAQFAVKYGLDNLICFVDYNKRQLDGACSYVMDYKNGIASRFESIGWDVYDVEDGNDIEQIYDAVGKALAVKGVPSCIVLNTLKGKGAFFAECSGDHSSKAPKTDWEKAIGEAEAALAAVRAGK